MKLAIIGAGSVGGTLGTAWAQKAGDEIFFGVRDPKSDKVRALLRTLGGKAQAGTPAEAAIRSMGNLNGKIILDATNPLAMGPDGLGLEIRHNTSAGEMVQGWARG